MPISDEIIELEPIKKSKTKLIIMMVAMGVLFALAVTFLIMYVLKPNVEKDNGKIIDVSARPFCRQRAPPFPPSQDLCRLCAPHPQALRPTVSRS